VSYTKEQIEQLWKESVRREENLVAEYKRTHSVPSRGTISTPEIEAERAERKRLYGEYLKALADKD
jgi:hypothetical protein